MQQTSNHLLRVLGMAFGYAAVVGAVVGQGILRSPGIVAEASDSVWVILALWVAGALVALISAMPFAELAAAIPRTGGPLAYVEIAFGRRAGIAVALMMLGIYTTTTAILCFVIGEYLIRLGVGGGELGPGVLGCLCLILFSLANSIGTRRSGNLQILLSSAKGVVLIGLVIVLFAQPGVEAVEAASARPSGGFLAYGVAMLVIVGTYNGWADLVFYGEEVADPARSIPRAIFGGIVGIAGLYLLINLAILHVLTPAQIAGSDLAAADAAASVFGDGGDIAFTAFGVLSVAALTNFGVMTNGRLLFAAGRDGILPRLLARVDKRGTPMPAIWISSLLASLFLISGTYLTLSATSITLAQGAYVAVILAAIRLRKTHPDLPRPFRMPLFPLTIGLALAINLALFAIFVIQDPANALLGYGLLAILWLLYLAIARKGAPSSAPMQIGKAGE